MAEKEKLLQWHAAFYAGIQIELEEESENLVFENEHMLGTKPMQIDVLIIKKNTEKRIQKNIGQIFRKYNMIEYKSPMDYLSINDFYKGIGYACFYLADTKHVNEIKIDEVTLSYVCARYPRKLMRHLSVKENRIIEKKEAGIYYITGELFPIQILVSSELLEDNNLWLKNLTNEIKDIASVEKMALAYERNRESGLYSSVMDIVIRANTEIFKEVKKMCEALKELFKEELVEKWQEGISQGISQGVSMEKENLVRKKILRKKTLEQIAAELEAEVEEILPLYTQVKESLLL